MKIFILTLMVWEGTGKPEPYVFKVEARNRSGAVSQARDIRARLEKIGRMVSVFYKLQPITSVKSHF